MKGMLLYAKIKKQIRLSKEKQGKNIQKFCILEKITPQHFSFKMRKMRDENKIDKVFLEKIENFFIY